MITCFQELSALTELAGAQKMLERLRSLPVSQVGTPRKPVGAYLLTVPRLVCPGGPGDSALLAFDQDPERPLSLLRATFNMLGAAADCWLSRVWRFAICGAPWHTLENPIDG